MIVHSVHRASEERYEHVGSLLLHTGHTVNSTYFVFTYIYIFIFINLLHMYTVLKVDGTTPRRWLGKEL